MVRVVVGEVAALISLGRPSPFGRKCLVLCDLAELPKPFRTFCKGKSGENSPNDPTQIKSGARERELKPIGA
jgi:hypothetical protein